MPNPPDRAALEAKRQAFAQARTARLQGRVGLQATIQSNGRVGEVRVVHGLGSGLDEKAIECVKQWRFSPRRMDCKPMETNVMLQIEFRL